MDLRVIFDGALSPATVAQSQSFTKGQFLLFNSSELGPNEGLILGMSIVIQVPVLFGTVTRIIPTPLLTDELNLTLDTNLLYPLPREVTESDYSCFVYFNSADVVSNFVAYVVTSDVSQESTHQLLQDTNTLLQEINGKIDQILLLVSVPVPAIAAAMAAEPVPSGGGGEFWQLGGGNISAGETIEFSLDCPTFILYAVTANSPSDGFAIVTVTAESADEAIGQIEQWEYTAGEVMATVLVDQLVSAPLLKLKVSSETNLTNLRVWIKPIFPSRVIQPD